MTHRNVNVATVASLRDALEHGAVLRVRGHEIRELRNRITVLERPRERCLFLPHRRNNVFASLAETLWVLAGRNDVDWLRAYLPRAADFSDDGLTWRAGYGPRLRNWNGVDQLYETRKLLLGERLTRRAVVVLYDPDRDFVDSKDIPCNNWLHWLIREDRLHLNVAVRSNDIMWGFSGINTFEWSVLHDLMAHWLGADVGEASYLASSFHLYERHYRRAERIVAGFSGLTCYDFGVEPLAFQSEWCDFDEMLRAWFAAEAVIRTRALTAGPTFNDPWLDVSLRLMKIYHGARQGWSAERLGEELAGLPEVDLTAAAYEYLGWKEPTLLRGIQQPRIAAFFRSYLGDGGRTAAGPTAAALKSLIKAIHASKDAAYGDSWKRRGELTSILCNIARKVDRLRVYSVKGTLVDDESPLNTAIDLLVYVLKYRLFLLESAPSDAAAALPPAAPRPFSDHVQNFEVLVDRMTFGEGGEAFNDQVEELAQTLEEVHAAVQSRSGVSERLDLVSRLTGASEALVARCAAEAPGMVQKLAEGLVHR